MTLKQCIEELMTAWWTPYYNIAQGGPLYPPLLLRTNGDNSLDKKWLVSQLSSKNTRLALFATMVVFSSHMA
jgi:hypothetical protein